MRQTSFCVLIFLLTFASCESFEREKYGAGFNSQRKLNSIPLIETFWKDDDTRTLFWNDTTVMAVPGKLVHTGKYIVLHEETNNEVDFYLRRKRANGSKVEFVVSTEYSKNPFKITHRYGVWDSIGLAGYNNDTLTGKALDTLIEIK